MEKVYVLVIDYGYEGIIGVYGDVAQAVAGIHVCLEDYDVQGDIQVQDDWVDPFPSTFEKSKRPRIKRAECASHKFVIYEYDINQYAY